MNYTQENEIINEKAFMMNYLWSLYTLAVGISNLKYERERMIDEKDNLFVRQVYTRRQSPPSSGFIKALVKNTFFLALACFIAFIAMTSILSSIFPFLNDNEVIAYIVFILCMLLSLVLLVFLVSKSKPFISLKQRKTLEQEDRQAEAEHNATEALRLENAAAKEKVLNYQILEISNLIDQAQYQLDEALSMNILHRKYRELPIIYIMFEYFETGAVDTLKEAINKYDQESRLDNIIENLKEIKGGLHQIYNEMLKQTEIMRQNLEINKRILFHTQQIASNTGITAHNTETIARNTGVIAATNAAMLLIEKEREYRRRYS